MNTRFSTNFEYEFDYRAYSTQSTSQLALRLITAPSPASNPTRRARLPNITSTTTSTRPSRLRMTTHPIPPFHMRTLDSTTCPGTNTAGPINRSTLYRKLPGPVRSGPVPRYIVANGTRTAKRVANDSRVRGKGQGGGVGGVGAHQREQSGEEGAAVSRLWWRHIAS